MTRHVPRNADVLSARNRLNAFKRHGATLDKIEEASRNLKVANAAAQIDRWITEPPALTDAERVDLAAKLAPTTGGSDAAA